MVDSHPVESSNKRTGGFKRIALYLGAAFIAAVVIMVASITLWLRFDDPTPVAHLLDDEDQAILDQYDGSMSDGSEAPSVLILGTPHFQQDDYDFADEEFDRVADELEKFQPDLVAVEQLPPDWPSGEGRDYRPGFDLESYAQGWGMSREDARRIVNHDDSETTDDQCALGQAYFLIRDLANAHYAWSQADCPQVEHDEEIQEWWVRRQESEHVLLGHPVARSSDLDELVSIDYQGDDAEWFLFTKGPELMLKGQFREAWGALPEVNRRTRELQGHMERHSDSLTEQLQFLNSPEQIALQYWVYEQSLPEIETENIGQRQADNYWRRNERMFERLEQAMVEREAERVLVITGAGHKYLLDTLVRDAGYRWVDPREWLPAPEND